MSVMTVRHKETLRRTLLFLRWTLSDVWHLFQALALNLDMLQDKRCRFYRIFQKDETNHPLPPQKMSL